MYVLQLMDSYAPSYGLLVVGLAETLALSWVYGKKTNFVPCFQLRFTYSVKCVYVL